MIYFLVIFSLIFLILTLHRQIEIKNKYLDNGYINHRKAFIVDTIFMIIVCISLALSNIFSIMSIFAAIFIAFIALLKWFWFKNYDFSIFSYIEKFIYNLFKKKKE